MVTETEVINSLTPPPKSLHNKRKPHSHRDNRKGEDNDHSADLRNRIAKIHRGEQLKPIDPPPDDYRDANQRGKRIRIYRNGDAFHKGINVRLFFWFFKIHNLFPIVLNMRHEHDINSFLETISERIGLIHGAKRLYTLNGTLIRSTIELQNNIVHYELTKSLNLLLFWGVRRLIGTFYSTRLRLGCQPSSWLEHTSCWRRREAASRNFCTHAKSDCEGA